MIRKNSAPIMQMARKYPPESQSGVYTPIISDSNDKGKNSTAIDYGSTQHAYGSTERRNRKEKGIDDEVVTDDDTYEAFSDGETQRWKLSDDFGELHNIAYSSARTGRHRRKLAARAKGGEFQASRRKRRLYFCCIGSEIDIQKLHDHINVTNGWDLKLYGDCLRLFRPGMEATSFVLPRSVDIAPKGRQQLSLDDLDIPIVDVVMHPSSQDKEKEKEHKPHELSYSVLQKLKLISRHSGGAGAQEVYIFEFGAAVFWGFPKGDESNLLDFIKEFVTNGLLVHSEFESGEDDFGFVTSRGDEIISIANDVITMPENTVEKQRLAISYAIAQSTILAIFEARVEKKVEEYKYIPETLAQRGQINLTHRQIGRMIGEIFVVRHDVNLHTVVLDTPDFFWKEEIFEVDYRMVMRYLEMSERVETVNKRLDMLKELLDVLEQQLESAHASKLEWIVIWLIVVEIAIEFLGIAGEVLGIWRL